MLGPPGADPAIDSSGALDLIRAYDANPPADPAI
jgi:hypothetical protein